MPAQEPIHYLRSLSSIVATQKQQERLMPHIGRSCFGKGDLPRRALYPPESML